MAMGREIPHIRKVNRRAVEPGSYSRENNARQRTLSAGEQTKRIIAKIQTLAANPRGPVSKKLSADERYRVRVGQYRILCEIRDDILVITVVKVANRNEAYR